MIQEQSTYRTKVLESIRSISKTSSSSTLKSAQKQLLKLQSSPQYFDILVQFISLHQIQCTFVLSLVSMRKSIAIFMLVFIRKHKDTMDQIRRKHVVFKIIELFSQNQIDFSIRLLLTDPCAQLVVCKDGKKDMQRQVATHLKAILHSVINFDPNSLEVIILTSLTLFKSFESSEDAQKYAIFGKEHLFLSGKFQEYISYNMEIKPPQQVESHIQSIKQLILLMHYSIVASKEQFRRQINRSFSSGSIFGLNVSLSMLFTVINDGIHITEKSMVNQLFWFERQNEKILQKLNELRVNYLILLTTVIKELKLQQVQQRNQYTAIIEQIANNIINNLVNLFVNIEGYNVNSPKLEEVVQHQVAFLVILCRHSLFKDMIQSKSIDLLRTIKKILTFSSRDMHQFREEPVQFMNNMINFLENKPLGRYDKEQQNSNFTPFEQVSENLQLENIKILSVRLFKSLIAMNPDLILKIVIEITSNISKTLFEQKKNLELILIINLIRDEVEQRKQIHQHLCDMIISIASRNPPNRHSATLYENFQYFLVLMTMSSYMYILKEQCPFIIKQILELSLFLVTEQDFFQSIRLAGQMLVEDVLSVYPDELNLTESTVIFLSQNILKSANANILNENTLDCLFFVFQHIRANESQMNFFSQKKIKLIENVLCNVCHCVELQINRNKSMNKNVINKCWNLVRATGQNPTFLKKLIPTFENIIGRLIHYLENYCNLDFQEDCFILMTCFIQNSQKVSPFIASLFKLIPDMFYGQYNGSFGHAYQALQMMLFYGSQTFFRENPEICTQIIDMSVYSLNIKEQSCSCQGTLLLQSIFLSPLAKTINRQLWNLIYDQTCKKFHSGNHSNFIRLSLTSLIGLSLTAADPKWIQACDISNFLRECGRQIVNCKDRYCLKVMVYSTCELLLKYPLKYFNISVSQILTILGFFLDQNEPTVYNSTDKAEKMLKASTINFVTKTTLAQYREYFIYTISQKLGELKNDNDLQKLKDAIEEIRQRIRNEQMDKMALKLSKKQ